jgi:hypothetical protein
MSIFPKDNAAQHVEGYRRTFLPHVEFNVTNAILKIAAVNMGD